MMSDIVVDVDIDAVPHRFDDPAIRLMRNDHRQIFERHLLAITNSIEAGEHGPHRLAKHSSSLHLDVPQRWKRY